MPREKRPEGMIKLRLEISEDHRNRLMVASAKRGQSMAACLRHTVEAWIDRVEPSLSKQPKSPKKSKEDSGDPQAT